MTFNPKKLPPTVYDAYKMGVSGWMLAVQRAIELGITDINKLTDMVFFVHHPELNGRPLKSDETKLISEWRDFRSLVKPIVVGSKTPVSKDLDSSEKLNNFEIQELMS